MLLAEIIKLIGQMKDGDVDIIECGIEIGYRERMHYALFGMFNIPRVEDKILKRPHSMTFGIPRIDDDIYKCTPTPGQLFTNQWGDAPVWVLSQEGEGGVKRIITPWQAVCEYYPPSPKKDIGHWGSHREEHQTTHSGGVLHLRVGEWSVW